MSHYGGKLKVHPEWAGVTEEGKQVFSCWFSTFGVPTDMANARRLVQCWNEHDDLEKERDELVKALRFIDDKLKANYLPIFCEKEIMTKLKESLAKYPEAS